MRFGGFSRWPPCDFEISALMLRDSKWVDAVAGERLVRLT